MSVASCDATDSELVEVSDEASGVVTSGSRFTSTMPLELEVAFVAVRFPPALDEDVCTVWEFSQYSKLSAVRSSLFCFWTDRVHLELAGRTTSAFSSLGACTVFGGVNRIAPVCRSSTCMKHVGGIGLLVTMARAAVCQNTMPHSSAFLVSMQSVQSPFLNG